MNLERPYEASKKPPSERLLYSDTCLTSYFSNSAKQASHTYRIADVPQRQLSQLWSE